MAVAIDCEMVGGGERGWYEMVARVSIVNEYENCVLDTFVTPRYKVTDYRTWISGITANNLVGAPHIDDVKHDVADIIRGRILVGHDMDKDLRLLGLCHPEWNKRDTSVFFRTLHTTPSKPKNKKPSLKYLARRYLRRNIQNGPHNSLVDARATMALYKLYQDEWESESESESESERDSDYY